MVKKKAKKSTAPVKKKRVSRKPEHFVHTDYLSKVFFPDEFKKNVKNTIAVVKSLKKKLGIDAIAFSGTSGAAFAFPVAYATDLPMINVRKKTDNSHFVNSACGLVEGVLSAKKYIIIDDFIASGDTVARIIDAVKFAQEDGAHQIAKCVGIVLYTKPLRKNAFHVCTSARMERIPVFGSCATNVGYDV